MFALLDRDIALIMVLICIIIVMFVNFTAHKLLSFCMLSHLSTPCLVLLSKICCHLLKNDSNIKIVIMLKLINIMI